MQPRRTLTLLLATVGFVLACAGASFALTGGFSGHHESAAVAQYCPPGQDCTTPPGKTLQPVVKPAVTPVVPPSGVTKVTVTCARASCSGQVVITTKVRVRVKGKLVNKTVKIGVKSYTIKAGKKVVASVKLNAQGKKLLKSAGKKGLTTVVTVSTKGGKSVSKTVRLKAGK